MTLQKRKVSTTDAVILSIGVFLIAISLIAYHNSSYQNLVGKFTPKEEEIVKMLVKNKIPLHKGNNVSIYFVMDLSCTYCKEVLLNNFSYFQPLIQDNYSIYIVLVSLDSGYNPDCEVYKAYYQNGTSYALKLMYEIVIGKTNANYSICSQANPIYLHELKLKAPSAIVFKNGKPIGYINGFASLSSRNFILDIYKLTK